MQAQDRTDRLAANFEARLDRIDAELAKVSADDPTVSEEENRRRLRNVNERIRRLRAEIARELGELAPPTCRAVVCVVSSRRRVQSSRKGP
jgi:uncharacterized protein involved in exopolysaccharide biosynthesis